MRTLFYLLLCFVLIAPSVQAQSRSIQNDPYILDGIDRKHFEPGGRYFDFYDRGTITRRSGGFTITPTNKQRIGTYSLQGATLGGRYRYTNDLDDHHPIEVHGAFSNDTRNTVSERQESSGAQSSYRFDYTGSEVHPEDGFDGAGGGGARDIYTFEIDGIATGIYPLSQSEIQKFDRSFSARMGYAGKAFKNAARRFGTGFVDYVVGSVTFDNERAASGGLNTIASVGDSLGGYFQFGAPELNYVATVGANAAVEHVFWQRSVQTQYSLLQKKGKLDTFFAEHPMAQDAMDAAATAMAFTGVGATGKVASATKTATKIPDVDGRAARPKTSNDNATKVEDTVSTANPQKGQSAQPRDLNEQFLHDQAKNSPETGRDLDLNNDPRFKSEDGWQKKSVTKKLPSGEKIDVHYQYNSKTGQVSDIKTVTPQRIPPQLQPGATIKE